MKDEFERCWPWLANAANRYQNYYTKDDIWKALVTGQQTLAPMPNSAMLWNRRTYPTGLRVLNLWVAGGELSEITDMVPVLERRSGCDISQIYGRRGWLKVLDGYKEFGTTMGKVL
jgi:hypothetical protein